jgi:hypothetical protein
MFLLRFVRFVDLGGVKLVFGELYAGRSVPSCLIFFF